MPDETPIGPSRTTDGRGHHGGGGGEHSPLQARAAFLKNRGWESVVSFNRGACARGGAQHGINPEAGGACGEDWERQRGEVTTLAETLDFLRSCHRLAPFLFLNGNTFALIGREIGLALFSDLPPTRKREVASAIGHYIAGVLDREAMVTIVDELCRSATLAVGDRVKTMRGSLRGVIARVLEDGRVAVRADGSTSELLCLPESLLPDD